MYEEHMAFARQALNAGNLAACEILCRDVLGAEPDHAEALSLLALVAMAVGERERAEEYFAAAIAAAPGDQTLRADMDRLRAMPAPPHLPDGPRYLLIKAWGYGFWADVAQVLGSLLLAEITGRTPVVNWGANSLFSDGRAEGFTQFFEPVSGLTLADLSRVKGQYFPPKWNSGNLAFEDHNKWRGPGCRAGACYFLNRPEAVAVSDFYIGVYDVMAWIPRTHALYGKSWPELYRFLIGKYLKPQPAIAEAANDFYRAHLRDAPFVAVHMRGTDKAVEDENIDTANAAIETELEKAPDEFRIFLLTDDENILARMKEKHGERLIATECQRAGGALGVHHRLENERVKSGREMLIDSLVALKAERFIGNAQSNVAGMIALLRDWPDGALALAGHNQLAERKLPLFVMKF